MSESELSPPSRIPILAGAAAACLPLCVPNRYFYDDWANHVWIIEYFGRYLRARGALPFSLNMNAVIGLAHPVFYGFLFYPLLGAISVLTGAGAALRIAAFTAIYLQGQIIQKAFSNDVSSGSATQLALVSCWAIYPLTNLYNRAALPEFFAGTLLICSLCNWMLAIRAEVSRTRTYRISLALFSLTLALCFHPISGLYGCIFVGAFVAMTARKLRLDLKTTAATAGSALLAALLVAPWAYAMAKLGPILHISGSPRISYATHSLDSALTRFSPFPLDIRTLTESPAAIQDLTPHLDAQVSIPLILLCVLCAGLRRRRPSAVELGGWLFFALATLISLAPLSNAFLPSPLRMVQFGFRLITYQNLSLLFLLLIYVKLGLGRTRSFERTLGLALGLAMISLPIKLHHAWMMSRPVEATPLLIGPNHSPSLSGLEKFARFDYTTPARYGGKWPVASSDPGTVQADFPVFDGSRLGEVGSLKLSLTSRAAVLSNVSAFPWNRIAIDGRELPTSELSWVSGRIGLEAQPGEHQLTVVSDPDPVWLWLRDISLLALAIWSLGLYWLRRGVRVGSAWVR